MKMFVFSTAKFFNLILSLDSSVSSVAGVETTSRTRATNILIKLVNPLKFVFHYFNDFFFKSFEEVKLFSLKGSGGQVVKQKADVK